MSDKLSLANELYQINSKNRNFLDELNEEELKKFSSYVLMKYSANVEGNSDMQAWYLLACNERVNKNFFDINKHPRLQWLTITSVSPGMGSQRHFWLAPKKKDSSNSKSIKFLSKLYPHLREDDIELMASINTVSDLKQYARGMGISDADIKKELG